VSPISGGDTPREVMKTATLRQGDRQGAQSLLKRGSLYGVAWHRVRYEPEVKLAMPFQKYRRRRDFLVTGSMDAELGAGDKEVD
jgi:hypothetical protein